MSLQDVRVASRRLCPMDEKMRFEANQPAGSAVALIAAAEKAPEEALRVLSD
jgi:hypothetical protein